ncbi:MAG: hypothetical protein AAGA54_12190 [Myxococcota bacterium]
MGDYEELRGALAELEAESAAVRLEYELDPRSLVRRTQHFSERTRLSVSVSRSLVLQAVGLDHLDDDDFGHLFDTRTD